MGGENWTGPWMSLRVSGIEWRMCKDPEDQGNVVVPEVLDRERNATAKLYVESKDLNRTVVHSQEEAPCRGVPEAGLRAGLDVSDPNVVPAMFWVHVWHKGLEPASLLPLTKWPQIGEEDFYGFLYGKWKAWSGSVWLML